MSFGHFVEVTWDVNVFFQTTYRGHQCPYSFVRLFHFLFYNWLNMGLTYLMFW